MTARPDPTRRRFLAAAACLPVAAGAAPVRADIAQGFRYEVELSPAHWRDRLGDKAYFVLREGGTELPHSSPLAFDSRPGVHFCRGCGLRNYRARWKVLKPDIGWVFFRHCEPDSVLTGIDAVRADDGMGGTETRHEIEVHCRRCGGHLGHIVTVGGDLLHCLNGIALRFEPEEGQALRTRKEP